MPQVKRIKDIQTAQTANGADYLKVTWDDDKKDNIFPEELREIAVQAQMEGKALTITKEKNGKYWNVIGLEIVEDNPQEGIPPPKKTIFVTEKQAEDVIRTTPRTKDDRIELECAIKAIIEMGGNGMLALDDALDQFLIKGAKQWCADQMRNYLPPDMAKPSELETTGTKDAITTTDRDLLYGLVMNNLKFPNARAAIAWLRDVAKVSSERVDKESKVVAKELIEKYNWK